MNELMEIAKIASEEQFQLFYGKVRDLVFLVCPESSQVLVANPSFVEMTGRTGGTPSSLFFKSFDFEKVSLRNDETITRETEITGKQDEVLLIRFHLSIARFNDRQVFLVVAQEVGQFQEKDIQLLVAEQEKKALLNEVYHRVKNNLNIIVSLLSLQISRVTEPSLRLMLLESKSRIFTLALLQQKLYASERISEVKAGEYLASLAKTVISSFKTPGQQIYLIADTEDCWLDVDLLMPLGLITHELVANAVIHAFRDQQEGEIRMQLSREPAGDYFYKVSDNGSGFPEGKELRDFRSLGSQLVLTLSRQLKTEIKMEEKGTGGTGFNFYFKVKAK